MDIPIQLPTNLYGWLAIVAVIISSILFIKHNDIKAIRENASDLRSILEDKDKEINLMKIQLQELIGKVEVLEKRNRTLEDLVVTALKQYFFENPKVAGTLQDKVMK